MQTVFLDNRSQDDVLRVSDGYKIIQNLIYLENQIVGGSGLLADGSVVGATAQAQEFSMGIKTNSIDEVTAGANVLIGQNGDANSYVRIDNNNSDARITVNGTGTSDASKIIMDALNGVFVNNVLTAVAGLKADEIAEISAGSGVAIRTSSGNIVMSGDAIGFILNDAAETATLSVNNGFSITGNTNITGTTILSDYLRVGTTIRTGDPGGGQGEWKLGKRVASSVSLNGSEYVEVMVDGQLLKFALAA